MSFNLEYRMESTLPGYPPPPARVVPYVMTQMRIVVPFNHESRDNHQPPRQTTTILTIRFTCQVF